MNEDKRSLMLRIYLVYLGLLLLAIAILARVVYIQSFESAELIELSQKQELQWFDVEAIRGNICSDDGTLLATSIPIFDVRMDLKTDSLTDEVFNRNIDSLSIRLSGLFRDRSAAEYRTDLTEARRKGDRYHLIKRKVTYPELITMRTFPIFRRGQFKGGLIVIPHYQRELPYKELARRTIGYESRSDDSNKVFVGLEGYFSENLQGITGKRLMRRIGGGNWVPMDLENELEPQNGHDIVTTIDINIQDLAEAALRKELIADSADHGCVVVMEVKTGHIKAIANLSRIKGTLYEERYNYAIGERTEPGSTFKLASFLVALEDGKVDLETPVATGNGVVTYSGRKMSDSHRGGYGTISAREVFEYSSNVGTSQIITRAYSQNPQAFIDGLYRMGIQNQLGIQLGGEGHPNIKNTKDRYWSKLSLPWMSIGYEVAMTPLQILTLYNAIANDGTMVRPLLVSELRQSGQAMTIYNTEVINSRICSPATLAKARSMLKGVVERGTATNIKNPLYSIAGKTGTAQIAENNKGYGQNSRKVKYKGSFVGYFPAENPVYSMIVVIVDPKKSKYYGASIAGPVFKEIADQLYVRHPEIAYTSRRDTAAPWLPFALSGNQVEIDRIYRYLEIPVISPKPDNPYVKAQLSDHSVHLTPAIVRPGLMPDLSGMGAKDALFLLENSGVQVILQGKGFVQSQSVPADSILREGSIVILGLGTGKSSSVSNSKPEA